MTLPTSAFRRTATVALAALALAAAVPPAAPAVETGAQRYTANLVNDDPRQGRKIENLEIEVVRLSTPEELAALANGGAKSAAEVGSAKLERTMSRSVVAAIETNGGSGKKLTVVFDKPLNWFDASRNPSAKKFPYGVVEIELDGQGKGQGKLIAGAQVKFGANGVEIANAAGEPMRIVNVATRG
jgi:hypothetical protein